VALGGSLAPTMLRPVQTRGDELNGGGVDHVDDALEAAGQTLEAAPGAELRLERLQMGQHRPEEPLGHRRVAVFVRVREAVAAGRGGAANPGQPAGMVMRGVADVVQADCVGQLRVEHGHHMAPRAERARLGLDAGFPRQFSDQMAGYEIAKLSQDTELASGWSWSFPGFIFHTRLLAQPAKPTNSNRFPSIPVGWL